MNSVNCVINYFRNRYPWLLTMYIFRVKNSFIHLELQAYLLFNINNISDLATFSIGIRIFWQKIKIVTNAASWTCVYLRIWKYFHRLIALAKEILMEGLWWIHVRHSHLKRKYLLNVALKLTHEADPPSRPVMITTFTRGVHLSISLFQFSQLAKGIIEGMTVQNEAKQNKYQWSSRPGLQSRPVAICACLKIWEQTDGQCVKIVITIGPYFRSALWINSMVLV